MRSSVRASSRPQRAHPAVGLGPTAVGRAPAPAPLLRACPIVAPRPSPPTLRPGRSACRAGGCSRSFVFPARPWACASAARSAPTAARWAVASPATASTQPRSHLLAGGIEHKLARLLDRAMPHQSTGCGSAKARAITRAPDTLTRDRVGISPSSPGRSYNGACIRRSCDVRRGGAG